MFQAHRYEQHGQENTYVDGGVLCNYPINCYDGNLNILLQKLIDTVYKIFIAKCSITTEVSYINLSKIVRKPTNLMKINVCLSHLRLSQV